MVHHRKAARVARRHMRSAHVAMKKAIVHKDEMFAYFTKMAKEHMLAHARLLKDRIALKKSKIAYHLSVKETKETQAKKDNAVKRRIHLVKEAKNWVIKADTAHHAQKKMFVKMTEAKSVMVKVQLELKVHVKTLERAASKAAKERAQHKVTMLKTQLKHRTVTFNLYVVKEANLKAIWEKLVDANKHAKKAIAVVTKKVNYWRNLYKIRNHARHMARKLEAKLIKAAKHAAHVMNHAIKHRKISEKKKAIADAAHKKAVAFKKLQVSLRIKAEKMTAIYKAKHAAAVLFGNK